jgi:hypothetical protein
MIGFNGFETLHYKHHLKDTTDKKNKIDNQDKYYVFIESFTQWLVYKTVIKQDISYRDSYR